MPSSLVPLVGQRPFLTTFLYGDHYLNFVLNSINESGHFCINFFSDQQAEISNVFASKGEDKLKNVDFSHGLTGSPRTIGAVAHEECEVQERYVAGDHTILIGRVVRTAIHGAMPTYIPTDEG